MLWVTFSLGFFGFLRAGEFTCPAAAEFSPTMLEVSDVSIDSHTMPTAMHVHLKQSKTDPFGAGYVLHVGRTGNDLCPVAAMLNYLYPCLDSSPSSKMAPPYLALVSARSCVRH